MSDTSMAGADTETQDGLKVHAVAATFSRLVFLTAACFAILVACFSLYKIFFSSHEGRFWFYLAGFFVGILLAWLSRRISRMKVDTRVNLAILFLSVVVGVYAFEVFLFYREEARSLGLQEQRIRAAARLGVPFDSRSKLEVIDEERAAGKDAYPIYYPKSFRRFRPDMDRKDALYPLSGVSRATTVYCNEGGVWSVFPSDEHGFNNSPGLYDSGEIEAVLAGDSYVDGACVRQDETIAARLRSRGLRTISVGKGGNGPLASLGALIEYAERLRPRVVVWSYYRNDLYDLENEKKSPLFRRYLEDDGFSQNLFDRQDEIDRLLIAYLKDKEQEERLLQARNAADERAQGEKRKTLEYNPITRIFALAHLRALVTNLPSQSARSQLEPDYNYFRRVLKKAKDLVSGWGGTFYFVYLPRFDKFDSGEDHAFRTEVLKTVAALDIPVIDLQPVFAKHADPVSLFPLRMDSHYTAEGYDIVAETVFRRLASDGLVGRSGVGN